MELPKDLVHRYKTEYLREFESVEYVDNSVDYRPGAGHVTKIEIESELIT